MSHMTNDKFYRLATLLTQELAFEQEDVVAMQHIMSCADCTRKLKRATTIVESMDNIALVSLLAERVTKISSVTESEKAIIQIVVLDTRSIMKQLEADTAQWLFDTPLGIGSKRSTSSAGQSIEKLEDFDNSKTFVSYDPVKKILVIQIDGKDGKVPSAKIKTPDGNICSISFDKRLSVYWAEVRNLEQGEYELILEK